MNLSSIFHYCIFLLSATLYKKYPTVHLLKFLKFHRFFSNYLNPVDQDRFPIVKDMDAS